MATATLVPIGGRMEISPKSILMLKADINYTQIYLADGTSILSTTTIGILENRLKSFDFYRPNRSTVINLNFVLRFHQDSFIILMKNRESISISRRKKQGFLEVIEKSNFSLKKGFSSEKQIFREVALI